MRKTMVTPYQYKLDLGEGEACQEAYQEYLFQYGYEDNNERWVSFTKAWKEFNKIVAMTESKGHTIQ
jgi:hypothetical protein